MNHQVTEITSLSDDDCFNDRSYWLYARLEHRGCFVRLATSTEGRISRLLPPTSFQNDREENANSGKLFYQRILLFLKFTSRGTALVEL
jgi:hypothetical protein